MARRDGQRRSIGSHNNGDADPDFVADGDGDDTPVASAQTAAPPAG